MVVPKSSFMLPKEVVVEKHEKILKVWLQSSIDILIP